MITRSKCKKDSKLLKNIAKALVKKRKFDEANKMSDKDVKRLEEIRVQIFKLEREWNNIRKKY